MKNVKLILLTLLLCIPLMKVSAQQLVQENATWNIGVTGWFQPNWTYSIKMEGDTSLNGLVYKKIFHSYDSLNVNWVETDFLIREDSLQKVYLRSYLNDEGVLYDFSLVVGDTFHYGACDIIVSEVDTIMLDNGETRKRMKVMSQSIVIDSLYDTDYWIEGMGSAGGLLNHFGLHCSTDHLEFLQCYYYDSELIYQPVSQTCFYVTAVDKIIASKEVAVFPNPTTGLFTIELKRTDWLIDGIEIYTAIGNSLGALEMTGSNKEVNISTLPNGMYHLLIRLSNGHLVSKRIIKTE